MKELLAAIDWNEGLRELDISMNRIGGYANSNSTTILLLSWIIIMHWSLQHLNLSECNMSPEECIYIGSCLN